MKAKKIVDRNPLTDKEVAELVSEIIGLDAQIAPSVLLLCHAFTHEMSYPRRESMMNAAVQSGALMLPAFDSMLMSSMAQEVAALRAKKEGVR